MLATTTKPRKPRKPPAGPFTAQHFAAWASHLVLDSGHNWKLEPFQRKFIQDVFSGKPECWMIVPEGNGKTTLVAGLALYHCQFTPSAWVPVAASSRDQAEILYRQAEGFIVRTPSLQPIFRAYGGFRRIELQGRKDARIQVFAADDRTGDGVIPTLCIVDELHRHRDMRLYRTWRGKLVKRNGQIVVISTAGEPGAEFEETRERIRQAADEREQKGSFLRATTEELVLHEWAVPEDGDVEDLGTVKSANPFSGVTVTALRKKLESPTMTPQHWRRFVCNLPTRSEFAAINEAEWFDAATDVEIPVGEPIWVGLDVGWKWDTTAAVPFWWKTDDFRLFGPAKVLEPPRDGNSLDPMKVERALVEINERNPIHTLVMDMSRAEQLASWAEAEFGCLVIDRSQSNAFAAIDYEKFTEALREGWMKHAGDREFTRHVLNAVTRILPYGDARFERPSQSRASSEQDRRVIDALTAAAMVHSAAALQPPAGDYLPDVAALVDA